MSEEILIAVIGGVSAVCGSGIGVFGMAMRDHLEAYRLASQMQEDNQLLWQWNRQLVDHIYKQDPPPPPDPPAGLFDHDND